MIGAIIIWSTAFGTIPNGWQICDGTNGTPDLTGLFVKGATDDGDLNDVGGSVNHNHPFTTAGHHHPFAPGPPLEVMTVGAGGHDQTAVDTGTTNNADGQPPNRKLFYIMRLS